MAVSWIDFELHDHILCACAYTRVRMAFHRLYNMCCAFQMDACLSFLFSQSLSFTVCFPLSRSVYKYFVHGQAAIVSRLAENIMPVVEPKSQLSS